MSNFIEERIETWKFPPTRSKSGHIKYKHDLKHIIYAKTDIFGDEPVIMTSDLHSHPMAVFERLRHDTDIDFTKYNVLMVGDMAGNLIRGSDGNPTKFYNYVINTLKVKSLYIVQGNHDLPPKQCTECTPQQKLEVQKHILRDGETVKTPLGKIGGVNGTCSFKPHPYKMPYEKFYGYMNKLVAQKPDILLTHDTPKFSIKGDEFIGNEDIYKYALKIKPKVYVFGHCHHKLYHSMHNGTHFFNVDARVLICNPT